MKQLLTSAGFAAMLLLCAFLSGCSHEKEPKIVNGQKIAMPEYYRKLTGYDSIQLVFGGRCTYNEEKQDYDVIWDSLFANFCYPNGLKTIRDTVQNIFFTPYFSSMKCKAQGGIKN